MAKLIVVRCPEAPDLDGTWFDLDQLAGLPQPPHTGETGDIVSFVPTDEFETNEDGDVAQVYVLRRGSCET